MAPAALVHAPVHVLGGHKVGTIALPSGLSPSSPNIISNEAIQPHQKEDKQGCSEGVEFYNEEWVGRREHHESPVSSLRYAMEPRPVGHSECAELRYFHGPHHRLRSLALG